MNKSPLAAGAAALIALAVTASGQTTFPELEPNSQKSEATLVNGIAAGDSITGSTTGTTTTLNTTTSATVDMFRVKTAALPLGIYKHTLTLSSATVGHTVTVRGRTQTGGVVSTTDTAFQTGVNLPSAERVAAWYGFGASEEVHYRVSGSGSTSMGYTALLSTTPVTPIPVSGVFVPGPITITTAAQGHTTDTEIYVYDANLVPVPGAHNDDLVNGAASSSTVTVTLAPGTYYVAVSNFNTANDQSDANPGEDWLDGNVLDFGNVMANASSTTAVNVAFAVSDGITTTSSPATKVNAFEIAWGRFNVASASTPSTPLCFGDGTGGACPCANSGAAGNGCANSVFPAGAKLVTSGVAGASNATDTLVLTATNIPGPCLFFQGTTVAGGGLGTTFGDGLLCSAGTITRLGVVFPSGNSASVPGGSNPNPIHVTTGVVSGDVRNYQCWYRDAALFCSSSTFNLTHAVSLTFGP